MKIGDLTTASPWFFDWSQRLISFNYCLVKKYLREWDGLRPHKECLDVGCGVGALSAFIRKKGLSYFGVDINQAYLEYARRKHGALFECLDARQLSRLGKRFDVAFSVGLFHHLDDQDCGAVLKEARSILNEDGRYFILDAAPPRPGNRLGAFLRNHDAGSHIRTMDEWKDLFSKFFEIEKSIACSQWPYDFVVFHLHQKAG